MNLMLRAGLTGLVVFLVPGLATMAQEPKRPAIAPEAKARLDALIAAYRALPSYADQGEVALVVKVGDRELKQTQKASIAFTKPNKLDVQTNLIRLLSDGKNVTTSVLPLKKYCVTPLPKKFAESTLRGGPLGAVEFGGLPGLPLVHVLNLVIGDEPERLIYDFTPKVLAEPDLMVDGVAYQVLRLDESDNHDWRFLIDPKSGLIRFVDLVVEGDATKGSIAGGDTHVESLRWSSGPISTEVPKPEAFAFQALPGFTEVGKLEGAAGPKEVKEPANPLVGKAAPNFTLDVLDGPGKFKKVSRADLVGKVVLIDFWATWCGPCLRELPDVQKLIEAYGKAGKEVVVVALSIDQNEQGDLKEAQTLVEAKLKEMKLTLKAEGANPVGMVALDPLGKLAERYGVEAIPYVVLIDQQGIIRAVHIGLTEGDVFTAEIDALLAGKPIEK
jgi:thiol-disulfide isomerase/thioredoxin